MAGTVEVPPRLTGVLEKDFVTIVEYLNQLFQAISIDNDGTGGTVGPLPRGWIDGMGLVSQGGVITMRRGVCRADNDGNDIRADNSVFEKTLAAFEAGDGRGMLDQGVRSINTWYHTFVIGNPVTGAVDLLASTSLTDPVLPEGFSTKRRILSIRTLATGAIKPFYQMGDLVLWQSPVMEYTGAVIGTGPALTVVDMATPGGVPKDIETMALFNMQIGGGGDRAIYFTHPSNTSLSPGVSATPLSTIRRNANYAHGGQIWVPTDILGRIGGRADTATGINIVTIGWMDPRGRDAA